MGVRLSRLVSFAVLGGVAVATPVDAAQPRIDKDTCTQLVSEQATFIQSGILADLQRGPAWGKTNLTAERMREIEHYILLDEQIKFGCRQATLTPEMEKASEIAKRLEQNSDADPFAPLPERKVTAPSDAAGAAAPVGAQDAKPVLKPKAERRVTIEGAEPVQPAAAKSPASPVESSPNDALKTPPVYIAPAPAPKP